MTVARVKKLKFFNRNQNEFLIFRACSVKRSTVGFKDVYIDLREPFTLKTDQLIIRLTPLKAGEEGDEISMFTKNQSFVANSQK